MKRFTQGFGGQKAGNLNMKYSDSFTVACWKDKREVYVLNCMHEQDSEPTPASNNCERTSKPELIRYYNKNMSTSATEWLILKDFRESLRNGLFFPFLEHCHFKCIYII
ncbi:hypothetical protein X975_08563, partial [Stegodyphus mimosarum]